MRAIVPDQNDSGLGFYQGSTDGVYNSYPNRGFNRPRCPEIPEITRRVFNKHFFRCEDPYKCHYDPARPLIYNLEYSTTCPTDPPEKDTFLNVKILILFIVFLILYIMFTHR